MISVIRNSCAHSSGLCILLGLTTIAFSACSNEAETPKQVVQAPPSTPPAFNQAWVPAAKGEGNFEICLSDEAKENGITKVTIPKNIVFQAWGPLTGPLRSSGSYDKRVLGAPLSSPMGSETTYAVITTSQIVLTDKEPCHIAQAQSVISKGFRWDKELVPADKHQNFAAEATKFINGKVTNKRWGFDENDAVIPKEKDIGNAIQLGLLNGTLLHDAINPMTFEDE